VKDMIKADIAMAAPFSMPGDGVETIRIDPEERPGFNNMITINVEGKKWNIKTTDDINSCVWTDLSTKNSILDYKLPAGKYNLEQIFNPFFKKPLHVEIMRNDKVLWSHPLGNGMKDNHMRRVSRLIEAEAKLSGDSVKTSRMWGSSPKMFEPGVYTIKVTEGNKKGKSRKLKGAWVLTFQ